MNTTSSSMHSERTLPMIDRLSPKLSEALFRHVEMGRLTMGRAMELDEAQRDLAYAVAFHRDNDRRDNLFFLDNRISYTSVAMDPNEWARHELARGEDSVSILRSEKLIDPASAVFNGTEADVAHFLYSFASAGIDRFKMDTHHEIKGGKHDIAFDFGYVDQKGEWLAPLQLDALVGVATDEAFLRENEILADCDVSVTQYDRTHEKMSYEFWLSSLEATTVIVRKRPYADVTLTINGDPATIRIFRQSWFIINGLEQHDASLTELIENVTYGKHRTDDANIRLQDYLNNVLVRDDKSEQAAVLPCTMTYVAQIVGSKVGGQDRDR